MYQVVLDTNVLVAALRSKRGASHLLLRRIGSENWRPNLTVALALEYEAVLKRERQSFGLTEDDIDAVLDGICSQAGLHRQYFLWRPIAGDPDDDLVIEAAIASSSDLIVTYNKRHLRASREFGIECLTPREFLILVEELKMKSVHIPDDVYRQASVLAERDQVSVDKLVAALLVAHAAEWKRLQARAEHGSLSQFHAVLDKVRDAQPEALDRL